MLGNISSPSTFYVPVAPRISSNLCPFESNIGGKLVQDYCAYFSLSLTNLVKPGQVFKK